MQGLRNREESIGDVGRSPEYILSIMELGCALYILGLSVL